MLVHQVRYEYFVISGKKGGCEINVLYLGQNSRLPYILQLTAFEEPVIKKNERIFLWDIKKIIHSSPRNIDVTLVEINPLFIQKTQKWGLFLIPEWVSFFKKTPEVKSELFTHFNKSLKNDMRKLRRYQYSYEITKDHEKFEYFYYEMYIPYIFKRYSNLCYLRSYHSMKSLFKTGVIMLVKHNDKHVAGNLLVFRDKTLLSSCLGIIDSDTDYLKKGVISAINYFIMKWAIEEGFSKVDFGLNRGFLNDGVFRFKRNWCMTLKYNESTSLFFGLKVCNINEGVCSFLEDNPFVFYNNSELEGFVFLKNSLPTGTNDIRNIYKYFWTEGLSRLNVVSLSGFTDESQYFIDSECQGLTLVNKDFLFGYKYV